MTVAHPVTMRAWVQLEWYTTLANNKKLETTAEPHGAYVHDASSCCFFFFLFFFFVSFFIFGQGSRIYSPASWCESCKPASLSGHLISALALLFIFEII